MLKWSERLCVCVWNGILRDEGKVKHQQMRAGETIEGTLFALPILTLHLIGLQFTIEQILAKHKEFKIDDEVIQSNQGRWAVVTGGGQGIGLEVVRKLHEAGMNVIIGSCTEIKEGCRDTSRCQEITKELSEEFIQSSISRLLVYYLELASFSSVKKFADEVIRLSSGKIHVLVNNAGVMFPKFEYTEDGVGNQMQINHLGHFFLIDQLFSALYDGGCGEKFARIVNVSSVAHYGSPYTTDNGILDCDDTYKLYMDSKFCQIATSINWNNLFDRLNSHIKVLNVHPGIVNTALYQNVFYHKLILPIMRRIYMTPRQGADCVVYAALSRELENTKPLFLINSENRDPHPRLQDVAVLESIWKISCLACGISDEYDRIYNKN